jgi:hypothetical protein
MWWKLHSQSEQINIPETRTSCEITEVDEQPNLTAIQDHRPVSPGSRGPEACRREPSGEPTGENTILASGREIFMIATKRVGDLVLWDNTGVPHRALPYGAGSERTLRRTTVVGVEEPS